METSTRSNCLQNRSSYCPTPAWHSTYRFRASWATDRRPQERRLTEETNAGVRACFKWKLRPTEQMRGSRTTSQNVVRQAVCPGRSSSQPAEYGVLRNMYGSQSISLVMQSLCRPRRLKSRIDLAGFSNHTLSYRSAWPTRIERLMDHDRYTGSAEEDVVIRPLFFWSRERCVSDKSSMTMLRLIRISG